jgi:hypothetical protein
METEKLKETGGRLKVNLMRKGTLSSININLRWSSWVQGLVHDLSVLSDIGGSTNTNVMSEHSYTALILRNRTLIKTSYQWLSHDRNGPQFSNKLQNITKKKLFLKEYPISFLCRDLLPFCEAIKARKKSTWNMYPG